MKLTKISIIIGTKLRASGQRIDAASLPVMLTAAKKYMLEQCGTYSAANVYSGWRERSDNQDWAEWCLQITATVDPRRTIPAQRIAADLRDIFDQKCVALEVSEVDFQLI